MISRLRRKLVLSATARCVARQYVFRATDGYFTGGNRISRVAVHRGSQTRDTSIILFPELYPAGVSWESGAADGFGYVGYRPMRTRLAPLPVPFDSDASEPLLAPFEDAMQNEAAYIGRILKQFGLWHIRHRPIFQLSTGECRNF